MITAVRTGAGGRAAAAAVAVAAFGVSFAKLKRNAWEMVLDGGTRITQVVYEDLLEFERIGDGIGARLRPNRLHSANDDSRRQKESVRFASRSIIDRVHENYSTRPTLNA